MVKKPWAFLILAAPLVTGACSGDDDAAEDGGFPMAVDATQSMPDAGREMPDSGGLGSVDIGEQDIGERDTGEQDAGAQIVRLTEQTVPAPGTEVSSSGLSPIRLVFSRAMNTSLSETSYDVMGRDGSGVSAVTSLSWSTDRMSCELVVEERPNGRYQLSLNSFQGANGERMSSVEEDIFGKPIYSFSTRP